MEGDYEWFMEENERGGFEKYTGEYLIVFNKKIVAHGKYLGVLLRDFREKYPKTTPFVVDIPEPVLRVCMH